MAYRHGNRNQGTLFPPTIDEMVEADQPVRAYDAMINAMDLVKMGFIIDSKKVGNSQYNPFAMLKLLVYGYSYGIQSSRKLERACYDNVSFIWLMGSMKPDHKTIAEFRRKNRKFLQEVIKQCAQVCVKLDLIGGNVLFVDGTKMRANASAANSYDKNKAEKALKKIEKDIENLLEECENIDHKEANDPSYAKMQKELANKENLKNKINAALGKIGDDEKAKINITDEDCANMHSRQGINANYNSQVVIDEANGLIVNSDVVNDKNDLNQFANQIDQANDVLDDKCDIACADAGYSNADDLEKVDVQDIKVVVPSQKQVSKKQAKAFDKNEFKYNSETDSYTCPANKKLKLSKTDKKNKKSLYSGGKQCQSCEHFGKCTKSKNDGRTITRYFNEEFRQRIAAEYEESENQNIYKKRKDYCEHPFGHIKRNLGADHFLMRGLAGVKAEMSLLASSFNIIRIINILGVELLVQKLAKV